MQYWITLLHPTHWLKCSACLAVAVLWLCCVCPLLHSFLFTLHLYNWIPLGTACAILYTLDSFGVHWVQCSEAAILAQWVQWVQCCWRLAGWLDQVAVPDLWYQSPAAAAAAAAAATTVCCVALLLSSPPPPLISSSSALPLLYSLSTQLTPFIVTHPLFLTLSVHVSPSISLHSSFYPLCFSNSHAYIQDGSRQADSAGFVMNGILLHIRRKCTLHCGFTNCLHCPKNDSLYTAENGSQPDSQTDRQHSANRQTSLQSLQTNGTGTTGRETDTLWQIQPA